jgi:pimeloyl-ACP methyl ester carboxylesterase
MKTKSLCQKKAMVGTLALLLFAMFITPQNVSAQAPKPKNVVLVHGAFADGSGWSAVYSILSKKGFKVTVVQNPMTSLEDDVKTTTLALDKQDGPTILVGHSYGGAVITQAGDHPNVAALVYVAAFQPDKGETVLKWVMTAQPAPESGILNPDSQGMVYYDLAKFHAGFGADIPKAQAEFMAASQGAFNVKGFVTPLTNAAWKTKPSYAVVATEDKTLVPSIQKAMYKRSNTKVTEIKGSHAVFISQPEQVAKVIIDAATSAK